MQISTYFIRSEIILSDQTLDPNQMHGDDEKKIVQGREYELMKLSQNQVLGFSQLAWVNAMEVLYVRTSLPLIL